MTRRWHAELPRDGKARMTVCGRWIRYPSARWAADLLATSHWKHVTCRDCLRRRAAAERLLDVRAALLKGDA